jgi:D-beta-D-heptose 7-phosphate kinase/D-beta-D-heptose 1-phosphate adenosyltransferase
MSGGVLAAGTRGEFARVPDFSCARVAVVGDIMLDRILKGSVDRISPEAPVPVVKLQGEEEQLGGAANVAANLAVLGLSVVLGGYTGRDAEGATIHRLLEQRGIGDAVFASARPTTTKIRVIGARQQLVRLDREEAGTFGEEERRALAEGILPRLTGSGALVLSDYGKGALCADTCALLISTARAQGIPVLVDPKTSDWERYAGAACVTPNFKEFRQACEGAALPSDFANTDAEVEHAATRLMSLVDIENLLITRSEQGMTLVRRTRVGDAGHTAGEVAFLHVRAEALEVFDVSGAGDTVMATLAASLAAGEDWESAVRLASAAAAIVVGKVGTATVSPAELEAALSPRQRKVLSRELLIQRVADLRRKGRRLVFTNGCFDLLHRGHVDLLRRARALGDFLIVGLNSDSSVRRLKGPDRPLVDEADRAFVLEALESVDAICLFESDTPAELIAAVRPDVLVKGGDYSPEQVVGREFAGEVAILPFVEGRSTSGLVERIRDGVDPASRL